MALDYVIVGLSISVLLFYFITLFLLLEIRARVDGKIGKAFLFLIVGVFFLILRSLEYIFFVSDLITIPYFRDYMSLFFSVLFLSSIPFLYCSLPLRFFISSSLLTSSASFCSFSVSKLKIMFLVRSSDFALSEIF